MNGKMKELIEYIYRDAIEAVGGEWSEKMWKTQAEPYVFARHIIIDALTKIGFNNREVADVFGVNRTTVMWAITRSKPSAVKQLTRALIKENVDANIGALELMKQRGVIEPFEEKLLDMYYKMNCVL